MGANDGKPNERPEHWTTVTDFELDITEVTIAQYRECLEAGACSLPGYIDDCNDVRAAEDTHPINCVSWDQASSFCAWAGKRLPLEAEWEYAARAFSDNQSPWGSAPAPDHLCWRRPFPAPRLDEADPSGKRIIPSPHSCTVGSHPADTTPLGIKDLGGNVAEWTWTEYAESHALDAASSPGHVIRGADWLTRDPEALRPSYRDSALARFPSIGFRCAR